MSRAPTIRFRGFRMTEPVKQAILAAEQRAGFTFTLTQGGFNNGAVAASAGTHDGDAIDLGTRGLTRKQVTAMIEALRWAGFAAWFRTTNVAKWGTRPHGFAAEHVHAVPNGWGSPSAGAAAQAVSYRAGRDGLARNLADAGPGHVGTWRNQTTPRRPDTRTTLERYLDTMDEKTLRKIIREEAQRAVAAELWTPVIDPKDKRAPALLKSSWRNNLWHLQQKVDRIISKIGA